jgi:uncharacterized membrane protein
MNTGRLEAFSDGVFAVAITVLVFGLLPIGSGKTLVTGTLLRAWPEYTAYVVSFLTIGIMWMNHHTILSHVGRVDRALLTLNLFLLLGVVAIPFPTALVAQHLSDGGTAAAVAAVVYGLAMIAISLGFAGLWIYVVTHAAKLGTAMPKQALRQSIPGFTGGLAVYVAGTLVAAFVSAPAAVAIYGLLAVYYLFEHLPNPDEDTAGSGEAEASPPTYGDTGAPPG